MKLRLILLALVIVMVTLVVNATDLEGERDERNLTDRERGLDAGNRRVVARDGLEANTPQLVRGGDVMLRHDLGGVDANIRGMCLRTRGLPFDYDVRADRVNDVVVEIPAFTPPLKYDVVMYDCLTNAVFYVLDPYIDGSVYTLDNFSDTTQLLDLDDNNTEAVYGNTFQGVSNAITGQARLAKLDDYWHDDSLVFGWHMEGRQEEVTHLTAQAFGDVKNTDGFLGNGYKFDGTGDYLRFTEWEKKPKEQITITIWIKPIVPTNGSQNTIIGESFHSYELFIQAGTSTLKYNHNIGGTNENVAYTLPTSNIWYHAAVTYDGANLKLYVDGILRDTEAATGDLVSYSGWDLQIGRYLTGISFYNGSMDELYIWNESASASDIWKLYYESKGLHGDEWNNQTSVAKVVGAWDFTKGFNQIAGEDLIGGLDFTDGWATFGDVTITDANTLTFTGINSAGVAKNIGLVSGKRYRFSWSGTETVSGTFNLFNDYGTGNHIISGFGTTDYTRKSIWLTVGSQSAQHSSGQFLNVDSLTVEELSPAYQNYSYSWEWTNNLTCTDCPRSVPAGASFDGSDDEFTATLGSIVFDEMVYDYWATDSSGLWHYYVNTTDEQYVDGIVASFEPHFNISQSGKILIGINSSGNTKTTMANFKATSYGEAGQIPMNASHLLETNMTAYYNLNGNQTGWILDSKGINNGTIVGDVNCSKDGVKNLNKSCQLNTNILINTSNDSIGVGDDSVSAWIFLDSIGIRRVIDNGKFVLSTHSTNNNMRLSSDGNVNTVFSADESIETGKWIHVVATRDSTGATSKIYINGNQSGAVGDTGTPVAGTSNVIIGNGAAGNLGLDGRLDEVVLWNRTLTASEVRLLYERGIGGIPDNIADTIKFTYDNQRRNMTIVSKNITTAPNVTVFKWNSTSLNGTVKMDVSFDNGSNWLTDVTNDTWTLWTQSEKKGLRYKIYGAEDVILQNISIYNYYGSTPLIAVEYPAAGNVTTDNLWQLFNCSSNATSLFTNASIYTNNTGGGMNQTNVTNLWNVTNSTSVQWNVSFSANGYYEWYCKYMDLEGIPRQSSTQNITFDTLNPPTITLLYPGNNKINTTYPTVFAASVSDDLGVDSCEFWNNVTGSWIGVYNTTVDQVSKTITYTKTLSEGTYKWNVQCNDTRGDWNWSNANWTIIYQHTPQIYFLENQTGETWQFFRYAYETTNTSELNLSLRVMLGNFTWQWINLSTDNNSETLIKNLDHWTEYTYMFNTTYKDRSYTANYTKKTEMSGVEGLKMLPIIIGLGVVFGVLLHFAFKLEKEHQAFQVLVISMVVVGLNIISGAVRIFYEGTGWENLSNTFVGFTMWFTRLFFIYVVGYLAYWILKKFQKTAEQAEAKKRGDA